MAKSNYLSRILFIAGVCLCGYACSNYIAFGFPSDRYQATTQHWQQTVKKVYDSQIGIREQGINSGPQVEDYLRYVNLKQGQPWCAAFICWVFGQAGIKNPRSGWSPDLFPLSKVIWSKAYTYSSKQTKAGRQPDNNEMISPRTGDIFGIFFPEKNRIAHAGFVDQWDGTWLITVEGNTNIDGSREGDGVYKKRRAVKTISRVARYIGLP